MRILQAFGSLVRERALVSSEACWRPACVAECEEQDEDHDHDHEIAKIRILQHIGTITPFPKAPRKVD